MRDASSCICTTSPGSFTAAQTAIVGVYPWKLAVGDIDGDGRTDLAMMIALEPDNYTPNSMIGIRLQQSDRTMGQVETMTPQHGLNVARMAVSDYDGDGLNDVFAYFTPSSAQYQAKLMALPQGPIAGQFGGPVDTRMQDLKGIDDAVFADLDGDHRPNAAVAGFFPVGSPSTVKAQLNRFTQSGAGTFAVFLSSDLSVHASRVTAGDVDGDGRNEIVVLGPEDRFLVLD